MNKQLIVKQVDPSKVNQTDKDELLKYIDEKYGTKENEHTVAYKKDHRWVGVLMLGLIGIATFWTIFVPIACIWGIVSIYDED